MNDPIGRRRSVDVGGLALALGEEGLGHGWGGWEDSEVGEPSYAEILLDVRAHTENMVNQEVDQVRPWVNTLSPDARRRLIMSMDSWHFQPLKLSEEEAVACAVCLFEALYHVEGLSEAVSVPVCRIASCLQHLCQLYRQTNSYHNFHHALDVLQAIYFFLVSAGLVPRVSILLEDGDRKWKRDEGKCDPLVSCLTNQDLFALYIAAVGHDVGHPGLTNAFMKNAKTPLAVVYDDKSVLEQMHYSLIMQIMRHHDLGFLLDRPQFGASFRKLLLGTVLATDMGVHYVFMDEFKRMLDGDEAPGLKRRILVCQALIKCADISNPTRPYLVAQDWAKALDSEWSSQLLLEKHLRLPASVKPSDSRIAEAHGQIWFISNFVCPLFERVAEGVPKLGQFAQQCRENLSSWEGVVDELSNAKAEIPSGVAMAWPQLAPTDFLSAFPPTLPESFRLMDPFHPYMRSEPNGSSCASQSTSSDSSTLSQYESCESSLPSPVFSPMETLSSPVPTAIPISPTSTNGMILPPTFDISPGSRSRSPSVASSGVMSISSDATNAIRAAYKASVRKKKSFHRSSWNPAPSGTVLNPAAALSAFANASLASHLSPGRGCTSPMGSNRSTSPHSSSPNGISPSDSPSTGTLTPSPLTPEAPLQPIPSAHLKTAFVFAPS